MEKKAGEDYTVVPYPRMRRFSTDAGYMGRRRHIIHGLLEVDVTRARESIHEQERKTGEHLSFTAFIITCLAHAVAANREVAACRDWRGRLVIFDDVDVNTMIETEADGGKVVVPHIVYAANRKTFRQVHDNIRAAQRDPAQTRERQFMSWFLLLPAFVRRLLETTIMRFPVQARTLSSPVLVTAVGMFGKGGGWGIPMPNFSLTVTLGGIARKPGVVEGRIEVREYLCVTLSFDHDIVDGAPAARFTEQFRELVESGYGL